MVSEKLTGKQNVIREKLRVNQKQSSEKLIVRLNGVKSERKKNVKRDN